MLFPTKDEIIDAVADNTNLLPSHLKNYKCTMGRFGPLYFPGGFCIVFQLYDNTKKLALRVWYAEVEDIRDRIKDFAKYQSKKQYPFIIPFNFYEQGLRVPTSDGVILLDIMTMEWAEGDDIKQFIKKTIKSNIPLVEKKDGLRRLAEKMMDIFAEMHKFGMSHGDLQHTNIIILSDGNPVLIDYDSFFFPGSTHTKHITSGYDEYQHPARKKSKEANEKTDYFSELIIIMSLLAYGEDPSIWDRYAIDNLDFSMLFTKEDFTKIDSSKLFIELSNKCESLNILCNILRDYLVKSNIDFIDQPFINYSGVSNILQRYGLYCIECGKEFTSIQDSFCTFCGTKRI